MTSLKPIVVLLIATGLLGCRSAGAQDHPDQPRYRLESSSVAQAPSVDGLATDAAWTHARPLRVMARVVWPEPQAHTTPVVIKSVHTAEGIYFLVRWRDETRDDLAHKPWIWHAANKSYEEGPEREDMLAVAFEHSGVFDGDMLSGQPATWDVWHWKAARTNPQGHAMDKSHRYTLKKPPGKAKSYPAKNGKRIWIARPEDAGNTLETKRPAPKAYQGDRLPQYLPGKPSGSAADVRAKGIWADGWWTLELERSLDTGHGDDTAFDPSRTYRMAVSTHDRTGKMDKATGVIALSFVPSLAVGWRFDDVEAGELPEGFKVEGTRQRGRVATWVVQAHARAPSKPHVLALTDTRESSGSTFNLCWTDRVRFEDGVIEVKVKAETGSEDQGGGPIWRVQDKDNYYIARWNPLEDNFRLYYVKDRRRVQLDTARVKADPAQWHTIRIEQHGDRIECSLDGKALLKASDKTFPGVGGVGLWTKADAATSFDDLIVNRKAR